MPELKEVRTSLEVGFPENGFPEKFARYRGRAFRTIPLMEAFPFEDAQFEVVMMADKAVSVKSVREAHRVLRPNGRLLFIVPERTGNQDGFTLPGIYAIVRSGFNIVSVVRPPWWLFGRRGRTIEICAQKKAWKHLTNVYRPYV